MITPPRPTGPELLDGLIHLITLITVIIIIGLFGENKKEINKYIFYKK
jgi:hypothetical protein